MSAAPLGCSRSPQNEIIVLPPPSLLPPSASPSLSLPSLSSLLALVFFSFLLYQTETVSASTQPPPVPFPVVDHSFCPIINPLLTWESLPWQLYALRTGDSDSVRGSVWTLRLIIPRRLITFDSSGVCATVSGSVVSSAAQSTPPAENLTAFAQSHNVRCDYASTRIENLPSVLVLLVLVSARRTTEHHVTRY